MGHGEDGDSSRQSSEQEQLREPTEGDSKSSCECKSPPRAAELQSKSSCESPPRAAELQSSETSRAAEQRNDSFEIENSSERNFETPIVGDGEALFAITVYAAGIFFGSVVELAKYENTLSFENSDFSMTEIFGKQANNIIICVYLGSLSDWEPIFMMIVCFSVINPVIGFIEVGVADASEKESGRKIDECKLDFTLQDLSTCRSDSVSDSVRRTEASTLLFSVANKLNGRLLSDICGITVLSGSTLRFESRAIH